MKTAEIKKLLLDWRVALLIVLIILSVVAIYPHFENGKLTTNLQYGLDLQNGAWIQLEYRAEVITFTTDGSIDELVANLSKSLDTEVTAIDATHLEIRKYYTQAELEPYFAANGATITSYQQGVSKSTAEEVKTILENKINTMGTKDAKVNTLAGLNNVARYVRIEMAGVNMEEAREIVGKQGKFEIRIQTTGNETDHVLWGDAITSVGTETKSATEGNVWSVPFTLSESGAAALRDAAIKYGATTDPESHHLIMILDNQTIFDAPLATSAAASLATTPNRQWQATTGTGAAGQAAAETLKIHLHAGALPVDVRIAGSGTVTAEQGTQNMTTSLFAGILALITVGIVIYFRYREPGIVLPMVLINASEMIILLGFIAAIQFQMDLPTIAGLIAVLGTGIDQLVIITDEILHEGKVPSPNLYLKRLSRALTIIIAAAATVFIAMVPLMVMPLTTLQGFAIITIMGVLVGVIITRPAYGRIIMSILSK
ncbi:MAG TPA: preprotein translocase subunit SecD [Methanoregulaceae archaeon]|nr:preprotein translocase subunit SecD [Methanoregulaceae archaeon]HPD75888.1 preprotein translocase subunit SecD [Methanoregulaceae archaeon]HRY75982.1 preprotein translocase subunit SecD [Methanoregulaceae archaeon]